MFEHGQIVRAVAEDVAVLQINIVFFPHDVNRRCFAASLRDNLRESVETVDKRKFFLLQKMFEVFQIAALIISDAELYEFGAVFHPKTTVVRGVLGEECEELMTSFFAGLRN